MQTFLEFGSGYEARGYRYDHGTGGWIFVDDVTGRAVLFPPDMPPSAILRHPMTRGCSGNLLASA